MPALIAVNRAPTMQDSEALQGYCEQRTNDGDEQERLSPVRTGHAGA
ncbi:hypothetical protein [Phyllobacterium salinisoli]|nr:hypothetical protein [Phyllobacterium salinisoli]